MITQAKLTNCFGNVSSCVVCTIAFTDCLLGFLCNLILNGKKMIKNTFVQNSDISAEKVDFLPYHRDCEHVQWYDPRITHIIIIYWFAETVQ